MRKFLFALVLLLTVVFVMVRSTELQHILETFSRGDWRFLLMALVVQAAWVVNVGASYRIIFQLVGIPEKLWHMVQLSSAANFMNIIAPSGGLGGLVLFFAEARKKGYSSARAAVSGALFVLFDYTGFLVVLALGLGFLFYTNRLGWPETAASIILLAGAVGLAFLLYLGMHSASQLGSLLAGLASAVNRVVWPFIHREYLSTVRARAFASDAAEGMLALRGKNRELLVPLALALFNKALLICVLFLVFLAFGIPFSAGTLIAGFSMGYLFLIVSPTPAGIGVVEGVMALSLHTWGVPLDSAAVVVLAYRAFTFWGPFLAGMQTFRVMAGPRSAKRAPIN
ncbi:MAG TPA: lysylphosphatidylglycerol synthase transmembrane domain-containing protein [Anaerolineaceae bacterium]